MPELPKSNFPSLGLCSASVNGAPVPVDWTYSYSTNTNDLKFQNCIIDNPLRYWPDRIWPKRDPFDPWTWPKDPWSDIKSIRDYIEKPVEKPYPAYNIVEVSDTERHLEFALAGIDFDKLSITSDPHGILVLEYTPDKDERVYKQKGISTKKFRKELELDEYWEVKEAQFENGLLVIIIVLNVPDKMKPKVIKITHK